MLVDVEAFFLYAFADAQAMYFLYTIEQYESTGGCPEIDDQDAKALCTEEAPTVTIESTVVNSEQTRHQCTEYATDTMY